MINRELAKGILKEELDKRSVGMPKGVELSAYLDCMEIYLDKSFVKVLELLVNKEKKIGNGLMSVRLFTDCSGFVLAETDEELFEFNTYEELLKYLKQ